jgi:hypothetical protein
MSEMKIYNLHVSRHDTRIEYSTRGVEIIDSIALREDERRINDELAFAGVVSIIDIELVETVSNETLKKLIEAYKAVNNDILTTIAEKIAYTHYKSNDMNAQMNRSFGTIWIKVNAKIDHEP